MNFKALNRYELFLGGLIGLFFIPLFGLGTIVIAPLMAFLYALGGAPAQDGGNKLYRRLGCAIVPSVALFLKIQHFNPWLLGSEGLAFAVYSIGYGIPSTMPPDEGSFMGECFFNLATRLMPHSSQVAHEEYASVMTHFTILLLLALAYTPLFLVR